MKKNKRDILTEEDRGVGTAENLPAKMFRTILFDLGMHPHRWGWLLSRYLSDPRNNIPQTQKAIYETRGNMNKELRKERITFPNLLRGIRVLNPRSMKFHIELEWWSGKSTVHTVAHIINRVPPNDGETLAEALRDEDDQNGF